MHANRLQFFTFFMIIAVGYAGFTHTARAGLFGGIEVQETYADKPWVEFIEQLSVALKKTSGELASSIATAEQHNKGHAVLQENKANIMVDLMPDEFLCEIASLTGRDAIEVMFHAQANERTIRNELTQSFLALDNRFGAQLPSEILNSNIERFKANYCDPQANNNGLAEFCTGTTSQDTKRFAQFDPRSCWGWKTVDADFNAAPGDACRLGSEDTCRQFLHYVSAERRPLQLPNVGALSAPGAGRHDHVIVNDYAPMTNHVSMIADTYARGHSKVLKSEGSSSDTFRILLEELAFPQDIIDKYVPLEGGVSEQGQLEIISKFMTANPSFMIKLQANEASISRVRTQLRALSVRLDHEIGELMADKTRHMGAINALLLRPAQEKARAALITVKSDQ